MIPSFPFVKIGIKQVKKLKLHPVLLICQISNMENINVSVSPLSKVILAPNGTLKEEKSVSREPSQIDL